MAPRKGKIQGKRNNIKIRSKISTQKRGLKQMKKNKSREKPLENLKWLNKIPAEGPAKECTGIPDWLNGCVYKQGNDDLASCSSMGYSTDQALYTREEDKSSSDLSDECNCKFPEKIGAKSGILKRKSSSSHSLVAKYIKSGMNHVASFIVESAIRFGEEHGVVVPDKKIPHVYEIMSPMTRLADDKVRKIRFRTSDKASDYDDAKKAMWKSQIKKTVNSLRKNQSAEDCSSWTSGSADSLEEILPLLEKLKEDSKIVNSDLDLDKFRIRKDRMRDEARDETRDETRDEMRDDDDDDDEEENERKREKYREKLRMLQKRYKSVGPVSQDTTDEVEYSPEKNFPWKKFKRDSLELGRQRLRPATCPRKDISMSPSPY